MFTLVLVRVRAMEIVKHVPIGTIRWLAYVSSCHFYGHVAQHSWRNQEQQQIRRPELLCICRAGRGVCVMGGKQMRPAFYK